MGIRGIGELGHSHNSTRRGLRLVHYRPPKIPIDPVAYTGSYQVLSVSGFWNSTSGKLCMVGGNKRLGSLYVVLKLDYPDSSTLSTSLVNGTLEIFNAEQKVIEVLDILGLHMRNYQFKLIDDEIENNVFQAFNNFSNVSLELKRGKKGHSVCQEIRKVLYFSLEYRTDCKSVNCDFLSGGKSNLTLPSNMFLNEIECWDTGEVRYLLEFPDRGYHGFKLAFEPNSTIIAEGKWDGENKRLDMVGCRISDGEDKLTDCSVRMILRLPSVFNLHKRSAIVGEMWSNRSLNESGYFGRVSFMSDVKRIVKLDNRVRYEFTQIENANRLCARKMTTQAKGGKYPDATSPDMAFDMVVKNRKGEVSGSTSPLFVVHRFYFENQMFGGNINSTSQRQSGLANVSYDLRFRPPPGLNLSINLPKFGSVIISAEGVYDSRSGHLCMVGCMSADNLHLKSAESSSPDCEILIDLQYPPMDAKTRTSVKGTIESTREKSDPSYFEPFEIVSYHLYANQAKESIWRMDLEITMVLISNTLACIFVSLQIFYVNKHPDVLPCISIVMLAVLTLAHMIPLLLNFEALFLSKHNRQNFYFESDGWLEVNEVLVRVITMVVFLLEFRLLQLSWSAKVKDESQKILRLSEKKVLLLCLPLYIAGGLIAWFSFLSYNKSHGRTLLRVYSPAVQLRPAFWGGLKSYAGLVLDGFLFPQILFNLFSDAREKALAPSFYIGTTFVRLLPHAYDLYRVHNSAIPTVNHLYANPRMDYYSTVWDIVICVGGLLFVILVWLQQRFGGRCFLPKRFRQSSAVEYEKVPVISA